ncbi:hypothetical protein Nepgr_009799 [Nepenthes gracilis]|uniref:Uncharacterized protein n=1 Tax=Nepenthes gracilis TaxID=150966 RepID=A0AAD3SBY5_NEPGR|nr:hypothetical protein Nepgr_009799 [Nepenthes gracilis]
MTLKRKETERSGMQWQKLRFHNSCRSGREFQDGAEGLNKQLKRDRSSVNANAYIALSSTPLIAFLGIDGRSCLTAMDLEKHNESRCWPLYLSFSPSSFGHFQSSVCCHGDAVFSDN